jgi:hypothetical protein
MYSRLSIKRSSDEFSQSSSFELSVAHISNGESSHE